MAYGDLSQFLPRASGQKLDVAQANAEAQKRASYLSSMDQFYESLNETKRQFDIQQSLATEQFEWMSGFEEKKLTEESRRANERLALDTELGRGTLDLQEQIAENERLYREELIGLEEDKLGFEGEKLGFEGEKLDLEKQRLNSQTGFEQQRLDLERQRLNSQTGLEQQRLDLDKEEQNYIQWLSGENLNLAQDEAKTEQQKWGMESQILGKELTSSTNLLPGRSGRFASDWDRSGGVNAWWRKPSGRTPFPIGGNSGYKPLTPVKTQISSPNTPSFSYGSLRSP